MARRPLIEPGSFLGGGTAAPLGDDLQSRIIAKDAEKHGRNGIVAELSVPVATEEIITDSQPLPEDSETNVTTLQRYNERSNEETNERQLEETPVTTNDLTTVRPNARRNGSAKERTIERTVVPDGAISERDDRLAKAMRLSAEDEVAVVTIRVSGKLNDYMDRFVARMNQIDPKKKYRKQDAVAEAFAAFFADHPMPPAPVEEEL